MNEYYLLRNKIIVNAVMTAKSLAEIKDMYPQFEVVAEPSQSQLEDYRYWNERC